MIKVIKEAHSDNLESRVNNLMNHGWNIVNVFKEEDYYCAVLVKERYSTPTSKNNET